MLIHDETTFGRKYLPALHAVEHAGILPVAESDWAITMAGESVHGKTIYVSLSRDEIERLHEAHSLTRRP